MARPVDLTDFLNVIDVDVDTHEALVTDTDCNRGAVVPSLWEWCRFRRCPSARCICTFDAYRVNLRQLPSRFHGSNEQEQ